MAHTAKEFCDNRLIISACDNTSGDSSDPVSGLKSTSYGSKMESALNKRTQTPAGLSAGANVVEGRTDKDVFRPCF